MRHLILFTLCATVFLSCKKEDDVNPSGSGGAAGSTATPNSVVTWGGISSMTNWACQEGSKLTIYCRSRPDQYLRIIIPQYNGPGEYPINAYSFDPSAPQNYASFRLNNAYLTPEYASRDSAGTVTITSFSTGSGLIGTFDLSVFQTPTTSLYWSDGVLDQVRRICPDNDTVFTYHVDPFHSSTQTRILRNSFDASYTVTRDDQRIQMRTYDTYNVANPSTQQNAFLLSVPVDLEVGTHNDLLALTGFSFSYTTTGSNYYAVANNNNMLSVEEHDREARHLRGSYVIHVSGGGIATGMFDLLY